MKKSSCSAEIIVGSIEELLTEILVRVPALSLIRFKRVSKHWLSLISDPVFRRRHSLQNPKPKISAFFSPRTNEGSCFKFLNDSVPDASSSLRIIQSCNGLFLCNVRFKQKPTSTYVSRQKTTSPPSMFQDKKQHRPVYVVNPTTNEFRALFPPALTRSTLVRYALAFDPCRSPHYKVLCVTNDDDSGHHDIDIYSSETGEWKHLKTPYFRSDEGMWRALHFDWWSREGAVYCSGAVHWVQSSREAGLGYGRGEFSRHETDVLHYFEISQERFQVVPAIPPVPLMVKNILVEYTSSGSKVIMWPKLAQRYFRESAGRLYLIETYQHCLTQFDVMEMWRDYSGWICWTDWRGIDPTS